ncbi:uncharacterized protein LOC134283371, partial [Saccostrea cucullata]|uniref:uncharacterized protein LOC134283371 n=1 Tax=Saccostrea cuccullata TaxID=36930 RepID=UPI002ED3F068
MARYRRTRKKIGSFQFLLIFLIATVQEISSERWVMVFRGAGGVIGGSNDIYNLWTRSGTRGVGVSCANKIGRRCGTHYKNKLVDRWTEMTVNKVKLAVYKSSVEQKRIEFSGYGTNKMNWMSQHRISYSSYSDMHSWDAYNYFGITSDNHLDRHFMINRNYGGCGVDVGWLVVTQGTCCDWDKHSTRPHIVYSCGSTRTKWLDHGFRGCTADEFAIYVDAQDKCRIPQCSEPNIDCYLRSTGKCDKCDPALPVKSIRGGQECAWMCSHLNRECWPGTCDSDNLASSCTCTDGFITSKDNTKSKCILHRPPSISTCFAGVGGIHGEHVMLKKTNRSSRCEDQRDNFINFVVNKINYEIQFTLTITPPTAKPDYIHDFQYGVGGGRIELRKITRLGRVRRIYVHDLGSDNVTEQNIKDTVNLKQQNSTSVIQMENGERLCFNFKAIGKGYVRTINKYDHHAVSSKQYQGETTESREVCFWYDRLSPVHCKILKNCSGLDIMQIDNPITRSPAINIGIDGWKDQDVFKSSRVNASGIRHYEITVYRISGDGTELKVDTKADANNTRVSNDSKLQHVRFSGCGLYEIRLEVVDNAGEGNTQMARRFALFDNCSKIQKDPLKKFIITTADDVSSKIWQTKKRKLCFDWTGRFYNTLHKDTNLLKAIEKNVLISEDYEDNDYPLPRNGTVNVDGIVEFNFTITVNGVKRILNKSHSDLLTQAQCTNLTLHDGDTVSVEVIATDIMGNFDEDTAEVFIDTSVPEITNIGLEREEFKGLFVHNTVELSKMNMALTIEDVHSGILSVQWYFGTKLNSMDIGNGTLAVNRLPNATFCNMDKECYCPSHGPCENSRYNIDMSKLMSNNKNTGLHNREYFFTFVVTNNAFLQIIDHIDILVDESAPVQGVVREGAPGEKDNDFTNENNTIVNWDGFIDHESGIRFYQVFLFSRCLGSNEILNLEANETLTTVNTTKKSVRFYFPKKGKYVASVIAFNNAGERSKVACSDGITYDLSPVQIFNFTGQRFTTKEGIACDENDNPFIVLDNLTKMQLKNLSRCTQICKNFTFPGFIKNLPQVYNEDVDEIYSQGICEKIPPFHNREIYVPSDKIQVSWEFRDFESQLDDFFVGFGQSDSEYLSPSLLSYTKTLGRPRYIKYHSGLRSAEKFWMYIKSINKAGVAETVRVGPMIIDSTPVVFVKELDLVIENGNIYIGWQNDTFIDQEEIDPVKSILFRIGKGSKFVTPFLQHYSKNDCPRSNMADCIIYPIQRLHLSKTENSAEYLVEVIVTNKAGHIASAKSKTFRIPSQIPPGPGIVIDTDSSEFSDLDYLLYPSKLCVKWKGFEHHENITFEVGIGTRKGKDDVIRYTQSSSKENH